MPNSYWCVLPELIESNWTLTEIRKFSSPNLTTTSTSSCEIYKYDYSSFYGLTYEQALNLTKESSKPEIIKCREDNDLNFYHYEQEEGVSIVPEWDLVCENIAWRSTVQVALSLGKFLGASVFGIIADRYGRKRSYSLGAIIYIISSILTTVSPWYWLFMIGRMGLGVAGAAIFYSSYTLRMYIFYILSRFILLKN